MSLTGPGFTFTNSGTLSNLSSITANLNNQGTLAVSTGTTDMSGILTGAGTLNVSGGTLNLNAPATTGTLNLSAGTLGGTGNLTVTNALNWGTGKVTGAASSTLTTLGTSLLSGVADLDTRSWNNSGAATIAGTGSLRLFNGANVNNQAGGTLDLTGSSLQAIYSGLVGAPVGLNNAGTLTKAAGSAPTQLIDAVTFNNTGTVNINAGALSLTGGGTSSGLFSLASGATLEFAGGAHSLTASSSLTGPGNLVMSSGSLNVAGSYGLAGGMSFTNGLASFTPTTPMNPSAISMSGGAATITPASGALNPATLTVTGGTLDLNAATTTQTLTIANFATLGGSGNITVTTALDWATGKIAGAAGSVLNTMGTSSLSGAADLDTRSWNNSGAATIVGAGV